MAAGHYQPELLFPGHPDIVERIRQHPALLVERMREEGRDPRIRWRTLAQLLGVPFESGICHEWFRASMEDPICWPRFLHGPDDGNLNAEELPEVLSMSRAIR
jgi:hypothetical protein